MIRPLLSALALSVIAVTPLAAQHGKATAYVCVDYACRLPTTDPHALAAQLDERLPMTRESRP